VKKSGLTLFGRFAIPCIPDVLREQKITLDEAEHLKLLIKRNEEPKIKFLERHFFCAVRSYYRTCEKNKCEPDFSYESVLDHWWNHHNDNHFGDCAVTYGVVTEVGNKITIFTVEKGIITDIKNSYNEKLKRGDAILIHRKTVVCKVTRKPIVVTSA
jgi:hypothetical protein